MRLKDLDVAVTGLSDAKRPIWLKLARDQQVLEDVLR